MHIDIFPGYTAATSLSLSHDGPIDPKLMAAAIAIDAARALKLERAVIRVGRITLKRHIAIALMAQEIVRAAASNDGIAREDFRRLGLSEAQIDELAPAAYAEAVRAQPGLAVSLAWAA